MKNFAWLLPLVALVPALLLAAEIPDLTLEPVALREIPGAKGAPARRVLFLRGKFAHSEWRLTWQQNPVPVGEDGGFLLSVPTGEKDEVIVRLQATGPRRRVQNGQYEYYFPRSQAFQAPKLDAKWTERVEEAVQTVTRAQLREVSATSVEQVQAPGSDRWFLHAGIDALGVFEEHGGGNCFSAEVAWQPTFALTENWGARGQFGFALLRSSTSGSSFATVDAQALARRNLFSGGTAELGGGAQSWTTYGGTHPILSGNLVFDAPAALSWWRGWSVGYSVYFFTPTVHFARLGAQFAF